MDSQDQSPEIGVKHTPGPWEVERDEDGHTIRMGDAISSPWAHESHHVVEYHHGVEVDQDDGGAQFREAEANARLITASPDMLASLKRNRAALDLIDPQRPLQYATTMDLMRKDMDAAIQLATHPDDRGSDSATKDGE